MVAPMLLFVSARLQAVAAALLCLAAVQLAVAVAAPTARSGPAGVRMALGR